MGWRCQPVSVSAQGYESFEEQDLDVIHWLNEQLLQRIRGGTDGSPADRARAIAHGAGSFHLKGRGGIKQATLEVTQLLADGKYPYIIRSNAKGYYASIRHHKLLALLQDAGFSREVCHVTTQLCQRMTVRGGIYAECQQGIPLGCAVSPALAAIYLGPLDLAMSRLPGVKYLRYMDDWLILCPSRWMMRCAVKLMHQTLAALGLRTHPDKTFIGRVCRGFDFLGVQYQSPATPSRGSLPSIRPSAMVQSRLQERLESHLSHAARLYEQGRLHSLARLELYLTHWLRYQNCIGVSLLAALQTLKQTLRRLCHPANDVMISTFSKLLLTTFLNPTKQKYLKNEKTRFNQAMAPGGTLLRHSRSHLPKQRGSHCHV